MASKNTVEIKFKAETEQFRAAIKSANSTMTTLRGELKLNAAQMKNTGASVEALTRKKKLLEQQDETLQQKINALASQLEASNAAFGENSASSQKLTNQLNQAKAAQQNVRAARRVPRSRSRPTPSSRPKAPTRSCPTRSASSAQSSSSCRRHMPMPS